MMGSHGNRLKVEDRYYTREQLFCPLCGIILEASQRESQPDSMKLTHPYTTKCERDERVYYHPGRGLERMPKEFQ
jgi:hypothetical protein